MNAVGTPAYPAADASRSLVYAAFAAAFAYPDREGMEAIRSGTLAGALRQLLGAVDPELPEGVDWAALQDCGADDEFLPVEFTRLFAAGENGPCCPLEGRCYGSAGMEATEDLVRFYDFFGLSLSEGQREEPDHLLTELEFLHYLAYQEATLAAAGEGTEGLLRAQRDFITRHPLAWVPLLRSRLTTHGSPRFFLELVALLERFLRAEAARPGEPIGSI
jgi:DMSO reductase family type II enzyme chaperone